MNAPLSLSKRGGSSTRGISGSGRSSRERSVNNSEGDDFDVGVGNSQAGSGLGRAIKKQTVNLRALWNSREKRGLLPVGSRQPASHLGSLGGGVMYVETIISQLVNGYSRKDGRSRGGY